MTVNSRIKPLRKNSIITAAVISVAAVAVTVGIYFAYYYNLIPQKSYTAQELKIPTVISETDYDGDGIDDYTDIMLGARLDAENKPQYNGAYYEGGYPPDDIGVCTDVIWRAFKNAGYDLKAMVDSDIADRGDEYPSAQKPDPNIDFRRVKNLRVFFRSFAQELTLNTDDVAEWQPGDIVIFGDDKHIGILSDKRNRKGECFVIHNGGQPVREEDYLKRAEVTGHYRFDASKIEKTVLK